jgi:cleavage and polyadenylation specificity factor subunit 2
VWTDARASHLTTSQAEFSGGVLLCGGNVTVRKDAVTQQLVLEGALSEDYYKIRGILYSQFHIL